MFRLLMNRPDTPLMPSHFKISQDLALLHCICEDNTWKLCDIHHRVQIQTVHEYDLCTVLFDQMLLLEQCVKIIERNCDSFLSKTFGDFLDQVDGKRLEKLRIARFAPA